jgi:GT2 family glycosyltransferase
MRCDIVIPVWNQLEHTRDCIESVAKNTSYPYRLILVDNGSEPDTRDYLAGLSVKGHEVKLIRNASNEGFVRAANQGLKESDAPYVCLLNNDTIPAPGWLERMVEFADLHKDVGLLNPVCNGHGDTPIDDYARRLLANKGRYMEMNQCFGFCMLIKREVIDKIGYLDEAFGIGGFDDTDYSMRAHKAGYRCVCVHDAYVYHKEHVSFRAMGDRKELVSPGEKAYFEKWPRHLRVGVGFAIGADTKDAEVEGLLRSVLHLAREWCWVNLWLFGDGPAGAAAAINDRIDMISRKIGMPLHQNIKFNFLPRRLADIQILIKLIERSFGTKARKRYDAVIVSNGLNGELFNIFRPIHGARIKAVAFDDTPNGAVDELISEARKR